MRLFIITYKSKKNNKELQSLLAVPYVSGSTFLESRKEEIVKINNHRHHKIINIQQKIVEDIHLYNSEFLLETELPVIKVLRHPVDRFWSWHNRFVGPKGKYIDSDRNVPYGSYCRRRVTEKNAHVWMEHFKNDLFVNDYTNHTVPINILLSKIKTSNSTRYIMMRDINNIFGLPMTYNLTYQFKRKKYRVETANKLLTDLYKDDIELINRSKTICEK